MVTVENIKPISNAGNLKAFAVITINNIRISDVRIIQQDGKKAWVSMPSRAYETNGQRKWAAIVEILDETLKAEISKVVLSEFAKSNGSALPATW